MKTSAFKPAVLVCISWSGIAVPMWAVASAPSAGCVATGTKVVARRWDAVLGRGWELVADCAHPEWPARSVEVASVHRSGIVTTLAVEAVRKPLAVHAGDRVRLWHQAENVRIEMTGVVEQSARSGDRVLVQVTRQTDDARLTVERIAGTVRGAGDVEMER